MQKTRIYIYISILVFTYSQNHPTTSQRRKIIIAQHHLSSLENSYQQLKEITLHSPTVIHKTLPLVTMAGIIATSTVANSIYQGYPSIPNTEQLFYALGSVPLLYYHPAAKGISSLLAKGHHSFWEWCHRKEIETTQLKLQTLKR